MGEYQGWFWISYRIIFEDLERHETAEKLDRGTHPVARRSAELDDICLEVDHVKPYYNEMHEVCFRIFSYFSKHWSEIDNHTIYFQISWFDKHFK